MKHVLPRIVVGGLGGGCGKTLLAIGIARALRDRGQRVLPFKKGPDYVDAAWLTRAAGLPCRNLDVPMMGEDGVLRSFLRSGDPGSVAVVEGARGLYDAMDDEGSSSTARLAKLLRAPVVLVVDCTKVTRTVAAMVLGCQHADRGVRIAGVVLNRIGTRRHEANIRSAVEDLCGIPVLGAVPRLAETVVPERHLGLTMPEEHGAAEDAVTRAAGTAAAHVDLDRILAIAREAPPISARRSVTADRPASRPERPVRVGVVRDSAFSFYYPENIEALEACGAEVVSVSATTGDALPPLDALYVGGGFPETHAETLGANGAFAASVRSAVEDGMPVYAECGGAVYMGRSLRMRGATHPMAGVLPLDFVFHERPQGHGYTLLEAVSGNPFFAPGELIRGHEFHYTAVEPRPVTGLPTGFRVRRGTGFDGAVDGVCYRNLMAVYSHIHASGADPWARGVVRMAALFANRAEHAPGVGATW